jgi:hypothetical protein
MKTQEEVLALLIALGTTTQEVAEKLVSLGIRGNKGMCTSCPIARYLIANEVEVRRVANRDVDEAVEVRVGVGVSSYWYYIRDYPQLQGVRDFILAFDGGDYPQCEIY